MGGGNIHGGGAKVGKGLVEPETRSAQKLLRAFFKGSKVMTWWSNKGVCPSSNVLGNTNMSTLRFYCRYSAEEIDVKVTTFRKMLMDKEGVTQSSAIERDVFGRPM